MAHEVKWCDGYGGFSGSIDHHAASDIQVWVGPQAIMPPKVQAAKYVGVNNSMPGFAGEEGSGSFGFSWVAIVDAEAQRSL